MEVIVVEIDMNSERMQDLQRYPAYESRSITYGMYFVKDGKIVGKAHVNSHYYNDVRVTPDWKDAATEEHFKNDPLYKDNLRDYLTYRFDAISGDYVGTYPDEPAERGEGLMIVDSFAFDFGIASKLRFGKVEGFGAKRVKGNSNG